MNCHHTLAVLSVALLAACGQVEPESPDATTGTATQALTGFTGPMKTTHQYIALTLLADGRALAADGSSSEVYDRASNQWTAAGPMATGFTFFHALVHLPDGRVLAAGGEGGSPYYHASASLFDPATNTWSLTGSLTSARSRPLAALLADGRVLLVGGTGSSGSALRTAETYNPSTGTWTAIAASATYTYGDGTATMLPDNRVLLVGGSGAELFDPSTGTFTVVGGSAHARYRHLAALLPTGKVLLTAGNVATSHLFDPTTLQFTTTGALATPIRYTAAGTVLSDGTVLVAGGFDGLATTYDSVERYNPTTGMWTPEPPLAQKREWAKMVQLSTGEVLVAGGAYHISSSTSTTPSQDHGAELIAGTCAPTTCAAQGKNCGTISDGCGGTLDCGTCADGLPCSANNICGCVPTTCAAQGKNCGTIADGCGGTLDCGICGTGQTCSSSNVCVCVPTTCSAQGKTCGSISDGCGGTLSCGTCGSGYTCNAGTCVQAPANEAQYDTALRAPACSRETSSCDSGSLLVGRAQLGPEPHAPNTIANSCADGTGGTFHGDESLDRLQVTTLDGGPFIAGKTVRVDATVWAFSSYSSDYLDLYYAADASNPSWVFIKTISPSMAGSQVLSTTYVLPQGTRQAIRGVFRYGGSAAPCGTGGYDDRDDLVFPVTTPVDTQPPTVSLTAPASGGTVSGNVTVQANAADDVGVTRVDFYVQPNTSGGTPTLIGSDTTPPYSVVWNTLQAPPAASHMLTARAHDAVGNETVSANTLVVVDNTPPTVSLTAPAANAIVSGTVTLSANAVDYSGIDRVSFYVDGVLVGTAPGQTYSDYSLGWNSATVATGAHTVTATAWDKKGNAATTPGVSITVSASGTSQAAYSSTWRAPACGSPGNSCDSGSLLLGRAGLGPEANAPNTLGGTCADGTFGTFHSDESIDRLQISTLDGGNLRAGATVRVNATVWVYSSADVLDIYYASSAASPVWTFAGTVTPSVSGQQTLSVSYTLPSGSTTQVVRGVFRYGGSRASCSSGSYDDNDDLVFAVQ